MMRNCLIWIIVGLAASLIGALNYADYQHRQLSAARNNIKAYEYELNEAEGRNLAYQLTVEELESSRDSVLMKLDETRKELKVKDKQLKAVQYVESGFERTDTVIFSDTVFREVIAGLDTVVGDEWYQLKLSAKLPSTLVVTPKFKSEKHVVVATKRETVNKPKKFFLLRWFQKKHTVVEVNVVEQSPYVVDEYQKYIEILK